MGQAYTVLVVQKAGKHMMVDAFRALDKAHMERLVERAWQNGAIGVEVTPCAK